MQLKKSSLNLSKLSTKGAKRSRFKICQSQVPEVQIESRFKICLESLVIVVQIVSRFKVSQSLAIEVQSWKIRFKICQSQALVVQVKKHF